MDRRRFGRTGMMVSPLGFGGAEIGFEDASADTAARLLNAALDAGLDVIDTGECYLGSEDLVGAAVSHRRQDYHLFTKCGHASGLPFRDWDPRLLEASVERSLRRLRTDHLDLLQIHSCSLADLQQGEIIAAVRRARDAGKTRFLGYSGDGEAARWAAACGHFDAIQTSVSIADQESIDLVLPAARAAGLGVIAKRPLANAAWRHGRKPDNPYHHEYWQRLQVLDYPFLRQADAVEIALRFTLAQHVDIAIVGTANPARWAANAALAAKGPLADEQVRAIRARWRAVAEPTWVGQI
jgi:aryl-alcohol dehydrogenase-like predicted oxidoreductase